MLVLDFGAQYVQLIARRVRERHALRGSSATTSRPTRVRELNPLAMILSGGPSSVYEPGHPHCDPAIFDLGVPILGICYGMQLICEAMGVPVQPNPAAANSGGRECRVLDPCRAALPRRAPRDRRLDEPWRPDPTAGAISSAGSDPDLPDRGRAAPAAADLWPAVSSRGLAYAVRLARSWAIFSTGSAATPHLDDGGVHRALGGRDHSSRRAATNGSSAAFPAASTLRSARPFWPGRIGPGPSACSSTPGCSGSASEMRWPARSARTTRPSCE